MRLQIDFTRSMRMYKAQLIAFSNISVVNMFSSKSNFQYQQSLLADENYRFG